MRNIISLVCQECKSRNYTTTKRRDNREKLEIRKYCKKCRRHTPHREGKVK